MIIIPRHELAVPRRALISGLSGDPVIDYLVAHHPGHLSTVDYRSRSAVTAELAKRATIWSDERGYSYGYNWAIDGGGRVWELRGRTYRNAANSGRTGWGWSTAAPTPKSPRRWQIGGRNNGNVATRSVLLLVSGDDEPTWEQIRAYRELVRWEQEAQPDVPIGVLPHRGLDATGCPGTGAMIALPYLDPATPWLGDEIATIPPTQTAPPTKDCHMLLLRLPIYGSWIGLLFRLLNGSTGEVSHVATGEAWDTIASAWGVRVIDLQHSAPGERQTALATLTRGLAMRVAGEAAGLALMDPADRRALGIQR